MDEEENTKLKWLSELKISLKQQKYPVALTYNSTKRALQNTIKQTIET